MDARNSTPGVEATSSQVVGAALVLGGGPAGIQAALDLADSGFRVYLADRAASIGGNMARLDKVFPTNECAMCILGPRMSAIAAHPNVEIITGAVLEAVQGRAGNFEVVVRKKNRSVDEAKCTGCGICMEKCPTKVPNEFELGLTMREAIYIPFPQAVPNVATIDRENCRYYRTGKCKVCQKFCKAEAIVFDQEDELVSLQVGAIIVATGLSQPDASKRGEYGFGRYPNVVTNMQFERMLSACGPTGGEVKRASDGRIPQRIAWIQCVCSREKEDLEARHCSAICCMQATKQALIAKEHHPETETTVFHNDLRAFGKGFEQYYVAAREKHGVRYVRGLPSCIREMKSSNELRINYWQDGSGAREEHFDLVVLSVGLRAAEGMRDLAGVAGFEMGEDTYPVCDPLVSCISSRPGVFLCGAAAGPTDIPDAVVEGGAAAAQAAALLAPARYALETPKQWPPERDDLDAPARTAVFVCRCGANIGGVVEVPELVERARRLPSVVHAQELVYSCSRDGLAQVQQAITEHGANRVVVAACTPRTHEPLFRNAAREVGLNPYLVEMANIREHCAWVHREVPDVATSKAAELLTKTIAKATQNVPLYTHPEPIERRALVLGGGLAGLVVAANLAAQDIPVELVEREKELGGLLHRFRGVRETEDTMGFLRGLTQRVSAHPQITVHTQARLESHTGHGGQYQSRIVHRESGELFAEVAHGATIVATGAQEYRPSGLGYGTDPRIMTQLELERMLRDEPSRGRSARTVTMVQCVGSRNEEHPYCSRICCLTAVKNALALKTLNPDVNVRILYRDMRTEGKYEEAYLQAREAGVQFDRYVPDELQVQAGELVRVRWVDPETTEEREHDTDLLVLSTGAVPTTGTRTVSELLRVPVNEDGFFLEVHVKLRPVEFASEGIFLCGSAHSPKSVPEVISQAQAAAARAAALLVHETREVGGEISCVEAEKCVACLTCVRVCPYGAPSINREGVAEIDAAACQGCGMCAAVCPAQAIALQHWREDQLNRELAALFEEVPT